MMRIGVDGACWLNRRGYGRYVRELVVALAGLGGDVEYTLMVDFDPAETPAMPPGVRVVRVPCRRPAARAAAAHGQRTLSELWTMSRAITSEHFDVVLFPSVYTYVPLFGRERVVVVIHDVIAEEFPQHIFSRRRSELQWWLKQLAARWRADMVVTVSRASREGIERRFGIPRQRIVVIPEAASRLFHPIPRDQTLTQVLARWKLAEDRFLLYVGGISPHKNLLALVDTFARLHLVNGRSTHKLVLAGDCVGDVFLSDYEALRQRITALQLDDAVVFTGYVDDAVLVALYNAATALILPSLAEGFGLPAIEAMSCGTPVVASARGSLPEVLGEAGVLFDPDRPGDLEVALRRVMTKPFQQARMRMLGLRRSEEFSWERAALQMRATFREVVGALHPEDSGKNLSTCLQRLL